MNKIQQTHLHWSEATREHYQCMIHLYLLFLYFGIDVALLYTPECIVYFVIYNHSIDICSHVKELCRLRRKKEDAYGFQIPENQIHL